MSTTGKFFITVLSKRGMIYSAVSSNTLELAKTQADNWFNSRDFDPNQDDVKVFEFEEGYSTSYGNDVYSGFYDEEEVA
jgi:hypothetical protein